MAFPRIALAFCAATFVTAAYAADVPKLDVGNTCRPIAGDVTLQIDGFKPQKRTGIQVDADSALQINVTLELGGQSETVTVTANQIRVDTVSTQLGEVVPAQTMTTLSLNGST